MTAKHEFKMAFLMDSYKAAIKIAEAIQNGKGKNLKLPWQWKFIFQFFVYFQMRWFAHFILIKNNTTRACFFILR
ncbi:MAG: hypothetical protein CM1200mP10_27420 [Candidatus Neomarinimicrobiota bacterium]|nr:MAG: hypothetical protein CM1200mP10_27420 [Candidatus Neomarinimicrobiota bacterium]